MGRRRAAPYGDSGWQDETESSPCGGPVRNSRGCSPRVVVRLVAKPIGSVVRVVAPAGPAQDLVHAVGDPLGDLVAQRPADALEAHLVGTGVLVDGGPLRP